MLSSIVVYVGKVSVVISIVMAVFCELESENVCAAWHEILNLRLNLRRCVLSCWRKMLYNSQQLVWHRNETKRMRLKLMVLVVSAKRA